MILRGSWAVRLGFGFCARLVGIKPQAEAWSRAANFQLVRIVIDLFLQSEPKPIEERFERAAAHVPRQIIPPLAICVFRVRHLSYLRENSSFAMRRATRPTDEVTTVRCAVALVATGGTASRVFRRG